MSTPPITSEAGGGLGADASNNNLALPIIEPLQSPVYGGQKVKITLPLELAEQADLSQTIITKILSKQESKYKKSSSSSKSNSSIPSLYLLITGSCKRHLCELKITNYDSNYLCLSAYTPEHEPPEKTKVSLIVWRMGCELPNSNEIPNENLSSAMTLTSKFSYVIQQTQKKLSYPSKVSIFHG